MTAPFSGPSVIVTSTVFGDLDGSIFSVPTWTTWSPFFTVNLLPSKTKISSFSSSAGSFWPPASLDSNDHVPWNFLSSFSISALSSAHAPGALNAVNTRAPSSVKREIRIVVLRDMQRKSTLLQNEHSQQRRCTRELEVPETNLLLPFAKSSGSALNSRQPATLTTPVWRQAPAAGGRPSGSPTCARCAGREQWRRLFYPAAPGERMQSGLTS